MLDRPEPFVWFSDFGDNALIFELHFWVKVRTVAERRRIESDIRYGIDQRFREAGLVIAFPQTDVHLDTTRPVDVRLHPAEDQANDDTEPLPGTARRDTPAPRSLTKDRENP